MIILRWSDLAMSKMLSFDYNSDSPTRGTKALKGGISTLKRRILTRGAIGKEFQSRESIMNIILKNDKMAIYQFTVGRVI